MSVPAIFLDRDGTLIEEEEYLSDPGKLKLIPGTLLGLARLSEAGYALVIVTNQSGVARGYFTLDDAMAVNTELERQLLAAGVKIARFELCPHHPAFTGPCGCRKPEPGMLLSAAEALAIDLSRSWMVGDKADDVAAGKAAGCRTALVKTGYGEKELEKLEAAGVKPDLAVADLAAFAATLTTDTRG